MDSIRLNIITLIIIYWCSLGEGLLLNRTIRQSCSWNQFRCDRSGQCIEEAEKCDGLAQCSDGSDESPNVCKCGVRGYGRRSSPDRPGLAETQVGSHPWHVGIYRVRHNNHHTLVCSGTLIYNDIVLTSANCLIDPDGRFPYPTTSIHIGAGKVRRDYDAEELTQQKFDVRKIAILDRYEGDTKGYAKNLGLIQLTKPIDSALNNYVSPICMWNQKTFPAGARRGIITGWGLQSVTNYGINLKEARISLMDVGDCVHRHYDPLHKRFLTNDKFCLTYESDIKLREDDTGGPITIYTDEHHYLLGVTSVQLPGSTFGIATKVSKHIKWIMNTAHQLKEESRCLQGGHFNCLSNSKCIKLNKRCDGQRDCSDGSDEDPAFCSTTNVQPSFSGNSGKKCRIPESGEIFKVMTCGDSRGCTSEYFAPSFSIYQITCEEGMGFKQIGTKAAQVVCTNGEWIPPLEDNKCLNLCPGQAYKSLDLRCSYLGGEVSCSDLMRPGTKIYIACKKRYKKQVKVNYVDETECKRDGLFKHDLTTECVPVCGVPYSIEDLQVQISNGQKVKYAKYPWHVALYWKVKTQEGDTDYKYQCGGTLIHTNKVLTAGHCIWEPGKNSKIDASLVAIIIGKVYSHWKIKEDLEQRVGVKEIIPGDHYNGAKTKHSQDIAVLILDRDVQMSHYTMPACLDLDGSAGGIPSDQLGHVVGWGRLKESDSSQSTELMESWMQYMDLDTCRKKFDKHGFDDYLLTDKFCVLYINGSGTQMGDSGGGMTFIHKNLYYVYGVVSIKKKGQDEFAAFTNVLSHKAWLQDIMNKY